MPKIVAYHPEILVEKGSELFLIRADLDDWYPDEEVISKLAAETGGRTLGEIVERIDRDDMKKRDSSILAARIINVKDRKPGRTVRKWTEAVDD